MPKLHIIPQKKKPTQGGGGCSIINLFFFEEKHPEYGEEFVTKHFGFIKPGILGWGFDGKTMEVTVLDEKNPFDKKAAAHGFGFSPSGPEDYNFEWVEKNE